MGRYQVIVGNIGTVYDGDNPVEANSRFGNYKKQSQSGTGRAGGEDVTLMDNGEPYHAFYGSISRAEREAEELALNGPIEVSFDELKKAFCDVLDGNYQPYEIQAQTGLTMERCEEISNLFKRLEKS